MPGTRLEPHGCPLLQSPAVLLLSHSPTHSGLRPPPKERPGDTEDHIRDKRRGLGRGNRKNGRTEEKKKKKPKTLSNSRDKRTVCSQTKRPEEVAREGLWRWPLRDGRADGAGGERRAREARRVRGRFCRRPRPAVPAAARLISHLAAPGPVCAEPGIPPAAQPAPAPSSPPPRSSRPPAEPGRIPGAGAHNWRRLDGAP